MAIATTKPQKVSMFLMNPMVRKLDKVEEKGEPSATYNGITFKTFFLLFLTVIGCAIFFLTNDLVPSSYVQNIEGYSINILEASIVLGGLFIALFFPLIAFKFVKSSMILGCLYSLIQGYALSFCFHLFGSQYVYPGLMALGLTILIVLIMLVIYRFKLININRKFMSMVSTIFFTELFLGVILSVFYIIPSTKELVQFVIDNVGIVLISSSIGIGISSLFLLVDFEVIHHCVDDKLSKKYEWLAAFSLSFAIIELYFKILTFILRITSKNKQS